MSRLLGGEMLIYHPVFDANHCVFRTLLILQEQSSDGVDIDLFRLMDFYVLFPSLLKKITPFPNELKSFKKHISKIESSYEHIENPKRIFVELRRIQSIAFHHLLSKQLIDMDSFESGKIKRTNIQLPESLANELKNINYIKLEWFEFIAKGFPKIDFYGAKGLKKRTGLMEYRYDEVDKKND